MDTEKQKFDAMFKGSKPIGWDDSAPKEFRRLPKGWRNKNAVGFRISDTSKPGSEFRKTTLEIMLGKIRCAWHDYQEAGLRLGEGHEGCEYAKARLENLFSCQDSTRYFTTSGYESGRNINFQWQQHAIQDSATRNWSDTYAADVNVRFTESTVKFLSRLRKKLKTVLAVDSPTIGNVVCVLYLMNGIQVRYSPLMDASDWMEDMFPPMSRVAK